MPASLETQVQSLGRWPTGCLALDKLLTLSEPLHPPQPQGGREDRGEGGMGGQAPFIPLNWELLLGQNPQPTQLTNPQGGRHAPAVLG